MPPRNSDDGEGMQLRDVAMFELLYGCGLRLSNVGRIWRLSKGRYGEGHG